MTQASPKSSIKVDYEQLPDRIDSMLVQDFILRTCIPFESGLIGYATLEKILYATATRFGERAKQLVRPILESLAKGGLIVAGPHRDAWTLRKRP